MPVATTKKQKSSNARNKNSETVQRILGAAETLMRENGYAAVTTRRLGELAGVKAPLVHYYFKSMDDLFVYLYRHHAKEGIKRAKEALDSGNVLQSLWKLSSDPVDSVLRLEFMALGNHRKAVRDEMAEQGEKYRQVQYNALLKYFKVSGEKPNLDPELLIVLMAGTGLLLALESENGMYFGHEKAK